MTVKRGKGPTSKPFVPVSTASQIAPEDRALFSEKELTDLENEVVLEVQADMRDEARERVRDRLKMQKRLEIQRRLDPNEEMHYFTCDLAPFADRIIIDGVVYMHGSTYELPSKQFKSMSEIAARTWEHEAEIGNANSQFYRKPRNVQLGPKEQGLSASQILRV